MRRGSVNGWVIAIIAVIAFVTAILMLRSLPSKPIVSPENQKTADSLKTTLPEHEKRADSLKRAKFRADSLRMAIAERSRAARERAEVSRTEGLRQAEIARQASNARDSAAAWRAAYMAEASRGDSLEAALNHKTRELEQAEIAEAAAEARADIEELRRKALEELQGRIMEDIKNAEVGRARFLGVPLPTKGELIAGALAYGAGRLSG
jgi:small-conductance mechanosensitive channel